MTNALVTRHSPNELHDLVDVDLPVTEWQAIGQDRIGLFADATGDHQWIHVDPRRAAEGPYGKPIAHGYLSLSLIGPLFAQVLEVTHASMVVNYGLDRVRFPSPLLVDSRVRLASKIVSASAVTGGVQVVVRATLECEGGTKPICVADAVFRYFD
ncbi:MaoC family dehydratase [Rhodococcus fascians]|nr:MaoC family dehydratase [Rhodococcus fascians]MBY4237964.1 MaoC family dehydratase [Rhodococcus fascians]MBY4253285.1 MaoC family dehydratase [Rhodococcus fascians]MBY4268922.1 MaoC family dehydratase [Rhodococcus fascians]